MSEDPHRRQWNFDNSHNIKLICRTVPLETFLPPVHPNKVCVTHLLIARNLWDGTTAVWWGDMLAHVVTMGENGLSTQMVIV